MKTFYSDSKILIDFSFSISSINITNVIPYYSIMNMENKFYDSETDSFISEEIFYEYDLPDADGIFLADLSTILSVGEYYIKSKVEYESEMYVGVEQILILDKRENSKIIFQAGYDYFENDLRILCWLVNLPSNEISESDECFIEIYDSDMEIKINRFEITNKINDIYKHKIENVEFEDNMNYAVFVEIIKNNISYKRQFGFTVIGENQ